METQRVDQFADVPDSCAVHRIAIFRESLGEQQAALKEAMKAFPDKRFEEKKK